ncbi:MAG: hypothetical protein KAH38_08520, partial [Candidatus Hydrogenedentes bacterium]|nr:hypothetical protein [Candidatus Hydrogenedentota bacterium]
MFYKPYIMLSLLLAALSACTHQPKTEHKPLPTDEKPPAATENTMTVPSTLNDTASLSADVFNKRVLDAAGSVSFVFEGDQPFAQCHASTITQANNGTLVAAWFAGTKEKDSDVGIWMSLRAET